MGITRDTPPEDDDAVTVTLVQGWYDKNGVEQAFAHVTIGNNNQ